MPLSLSVPSSSLLIGAGYLFLSGQAALDLVVREAVARSGGALEIDGATGSLLDTVRIRRITWRGPDTRASADDVALTWNPAGAHVPRHRRARTRCAAPHARDERGDGRRTYAGEHGIADRGQHRTCWRRRARLARRHESRHDPWPRVRLRGRRDRAPGLCSHVRRAAGSGHRQCDDGFRCTVSHCGAPQGEGGRRARGHRGRPRARGFARGAHARRHRQRAERTASPATRRSHRSPQRRCAKWRSTPAASISLPGIPRCRQRISGSPCARALRTARSPARSKRPTPRSAASMPDGRRLPPFRPALRGATTCCRSNSIAATLEGGGAIAGQAQIPLGVADAAGSFDARAAQHRLAPDLCAAGRDAPFREARCRSRHERAADPRRCRGPHAARRNCAGFRRGRHRQIASSSSGFALGPERASSPAAVVSRWTRSAGSSSTRPRCGSTPPRTARFPRGRSMAVSWPGARSPLPGASQLDIALAQGSRLAGVAVAGTARGTLTRESIRDAAIDLSAGRARLTATGSAGYPGDTGERITVALDSPNLAELAPLLPASPARALEGASTPRRSLRDCRRAPASSSTPKAND